MNTATRTMNLLDLDTLSIDSDFQALVTAGRNTPLEKDSLTWRFQSTGNDILDAACGGRQDERGIPVGRLTVFSGKTGSYKTYHVLEAAINFLLENPKHVVGVVDTEESWSDMYLQTMGIPSSLADRIQIIRSPAETPAVYLEHLYPAILAYIDRSDSTGLKPMIIIDSLSNIPTLADEEILTSGDAAKFNSTKNKTLKRFTKALPGILKEKEITMIVVSHLVQELFKKTSSFMGPSYKEEVTEAIGYIASLTIRLERVFSEEGKPSDTGYAAGMTVSEQVRIRAKAIKTRNNPENSVQYVMIPGFGCDNLNSVLEFLETGLGKLGGANAYKDKIQEVLTVLKLPSSFSSKGEYTATIKAFALETAKNLSLVRKQLRPIVFEVWDKLLEKRRPYKYSKYSYLEEDGK